MNRINNQDKTILNQNLVNYDRAMEIQQLLIDCIEHVSKKSINTVVKEIKKDREAFIITKPITMEQFIRLTNYVNLWLPILFHPDETPQSVIRFTGTPIVMTHDNFIKALVAIYYTVHHKVTKPPVVKGINATMSCIRSGATKSINLVTFLDVMDYALYGADKPFDFMCSIITPQQVIKNRKLRVSRNKKITVNDTPQEEYLKILLDKEEQI